MKFTRSAWPVRLFIFAVIAAAVTVVLVLRSDVPASIFAQERDNDTAKPAMTKRESAGVSQLRVMLAADGVTINESDLLPARVDESSTMLVRFDAVGAEAPGGEYLRAVPESSTASLIETHDGKGPLARLRAIELAANQIVTIATGQNREALWWSVQTDPRIFYAETAGASGQMSGQPLYRAAADMLVSYPTDKKIEVLRFYHPRWDGHSFELQPIGQIAAGGGK